MIFLKKREELFIIFLTGAFVYGLIEILFRGFTHWTMAITGGVAFLLIHIINTKAKNTGLFFKCLTGCFIITGLELIVGIIVNRQLHLNVWDYSTQSFNLLGQICPLFSFLWFLISAPAIFLSRFISKKLNSFLS